MKNYMNIAMLSLSFASMANGQEAPSAERFIDAQGCFDLYEDSQLGACLERQIDTCWNATGGVSVSSGQCMYEAYDQADALLNSYYQVLVPATRLAADGLEGSAYALNWNPLRESQRAWVTVRDSTCDLSVLYAATGPGRDSHVAGCKARLTMQRIGILRTELGWTMDSRY